MGTMDACNLILFNDCCSPVLLDALTVSAGESW